MKIGRFKHFVARLVRCILLAGFCAEVVLAQSDAPPAAVGGTNLPLSLQELLRANLQLQEQLHATQLAIEQNSKAAEAAASRNAEITRNAEVMSARLNLLEQELASQRARELEVLQSSNRFLLAVAATLAGVVLLTLLLAGYIQWRAANRFASMPTALPARALGEGHIVSSPGTDQAALVPVSRTEQSNSRLLGVIGLLEQRIFQLEHMTSTHQPLMETSHQPAGTAVNEPSGGSVPVSGAQSASSETATPVALWLGKGQSLLNLEQPENALACFDEALQLDPNNAEALIKKGAALERLEKPDEAIACYDRAIAVDQFKTMAYLHKGGLCNRLARHNEALECYEQALRAQQRSHAV